MQAQCLEIASFGAAASQGTIKSVDPKTDLITLSDGKTFVLSEGVEAEH